MNIIKKIASFHTDESRYDPEGRHYRFRKGTIQGHDIEIKEMNGIYHAKMDNKVEINMDEGGLVNFIVSTLKRR